ncbi:MAG: acyl-CoA thioester hydrolase/BAAT C-terminal domain-containing protein, partial [Wenzhouxiangella sp.]|nr:acyl-CoA thioester hydrolase/BAAT C-terminal domain-containing protein [Wenzhouxiangella sp.]
RAIVRPSLDNLSTVTLTTSHILRYRGPDTVREEIAEGDLRGVLYFPRGVESPPTLITMNGSDGGVYEPGAALIATRGFAVLALASHDYAGRPDDLALIPLEYWREAIDYMRERFDDERTALLGMSRGGELALLVPSIWPDRVDAVVANVPSNVVNSACCNPETWSKAAFTLNGEPVAFWEPDLSYEGFDPTSGLPMSYRLTYLKAMLGPDTIGPAIEVEKIDAPILLISGDADRLWPGDIAAKMVEKRLREHGFAHEVVNVVHAGAGHWATSTTHNTSASPGLTEAGDRNDLPTGGTVRANARAIHASVKLQLDFLRKYARND